MTTTATPISAAGRRERFYGWLAGELIVRAVRLAIRRGDRHEFDHLRASITAGSTSAASHADGCLLRDAPRAGRGFGVEIEFDLGR